MPIAISRNENDSEFYGLPLFEANEEFYKALTDGLENYWRAIRGFSARKFLPNACQ